jgi:hypothetical protein
MKLLNLLPLLVLLSCAKTKTDETSVSNITKTDTVVSNSSTDSATANNDKTDYAGVYEYGKDVEKEPVGQLTLHKQTADTYLFYLDVNRGAPSYNSGAIYGSLTVKDGEATYNNQLDYGDKPCMLDFVFAGMAIKVTSGADIDCGFGNGVYADGDFTKTKTTAPDFFVNGEGTKIYFNKTTPEDYNK